MSVRALKPRPIVQPWRQLPGCSAEVHPIGLHENNWRQRRYGDKAMLCQHRSVVEIDDRTYCARHAGQIALERWLSGKLVESGG